MLSSFSISILGVIDYGFKSQIAILSQIMLVESLVESKSAGREGEKWARSELLVRNGSSLVVWRRHRLRTQDLVGIDDLHEKLAASIRIA